MGVLVGVKAVVENDILRNARFRSQIFKILFASGGKGALTPPDQNPTDALGPVYNSCSASTQVRSGIGV